MSEARWRSGVAGIVAVSAVALVTAILVGTGGDPTEDRDRVLAETCRNVLQRAGSYEQVADERPEVLDAATYGQARDADRTDGRRPSSVVVFRATCRSSSRSDQLSVFIERLRSRSP